MLSAHQFEFLKSVLRFKSYSHLKSIKMSLKMEKSITETKRKTGFIKWSFYLPKKSVFCS